MALSRVPGDDELYVGGYVVTSVLPLLLGVWLHRNLIREGSHMSSLFRVILKGVSEE